MKQQQVEIESVEEWKERRVKKKGGDERKHNIHWCFFYCLRFVSLGAYLSSFFFASWNLTTTKK